MDYPTRTTSSTSSSTERRSRRDEQRQLLVLQRPGVQPEDRARRRALDRRSRYAYGNLDIDIAKNHAPLATYTTTNAVCYFSCRRVRLLRFHAGLRASTSRLSAVQ